MRRLVLMAFLVSACGSGSDGATGAPEAGGALTGGEQGTSVGGSAPGAGTGGTSQGPTAQQGGSVAADGGSAASSGGSSGSSVSTGGGALEFLDEPHTGSFWLGPVDYAESEWHNACAPENKYPPAIQELYGNYIMGLANEVTLMGLSASAGRLCDVCVELAANGESLIAHVVTYGQETGPNDIDVSPEIDAALDGNAGRTATWRFVACPAAGPIQYTFDGRQWDNTWFFRVWVRNATLPVSLVEYSIGDGPWTSTDGQTDGAWQASSQDFSGGFSLRVTAIDDQTIEDELPGLGMFDPDVGVPSHGNFELF